MAAPYYCRLCKFKRSIRRISQLWDTAHTLNLENWRSSISILYNITISWLHPLNGFWFYFLFRDNENALSSWRNSFHSVRPHPWLQLVAVICKVIEHMCWTACLKASDKLNRFFPSLSSLIDDKRESTDHLYINQSLLSLFFQIKRMNSYIWPQGKKGFKRKNSL